MVWTTTYDPDTDMPSLVGKVILITGGTVGIGKQAIIEFAKHRPRAVYFTGRDAAAAKLTIEEAKALSTGTNFVFLEADHTSLKSVAMAARTFLDASTRLDVLICNAGVMGVAANMTEDHFEVQWQVNYLAHALLVKSLLPVLDRTASEHGSARVVMVSSAGFKLAPKAGIIFDDLKTEQENLGFTSKWLRYGQSKLAMVLLGKQIAARYPNIIALSIHPGVITTGLVNNLPFLDRVFVHLNTMGQAVDVKKGTLNTCWAATTVDTKTLRSGGIYFPLGVLEPDSEHSKNEAMGNKLWDWTEEHLTTFV